MHQKERKAKSELSRNWTLPTTLLIEMDGAFLDNRDLLFDAYFALLHKYGIEGSKVEFNELVGLLPKELILHLSDKYGLKNNLEALELEYITYLKTKYKDHIYPRQGALECLRIAQQLGFSLALVSMMDRTTTQDILTPHQLQKTFDAIATASEVPVNESRSSNLYQHALSIVGSDEEETLAIAFSSHAVEALKEAGIHTLWLKFNVRENIPKHFFGSDKKYAQVKDWKNVLHCLQKWYATQTQIGTLAPADKGSAG